MEKSALQQEEFCVCVCVCVHVGQLWGLVIRFFSLEGQAFQAKTGIRTAASEIHK